MTLQKVIDSLINFKKYAPTESDADFYENLIKQLDEIEKYTIDLRKYTNIDLLFTFAMITAKSEFGLVDEIENQIILNKIPDAVNKIFLDMVEEAKQHIKQQIVVIEKDSVVMQEMSDSIN